MVEIRIFDWPKDGGAMVCRGITYNAAEVSTREQLYSPGSFELKIPGDERYAPAFQKYCLVRIGGGFWGMVDGVRYDSDEGDYMTVTGRDLKGLTALRVTVPPEVTDVTGTAGYDAATGPTETLMKRFVRNNFFPPSDPNRHVTGLVIAPDLGRGVADDRYMTRFEDLSEVLARLGESAGMGYGVTPTEDGRQFVFDVVQGEDRTAGQRARPPVIFEMARRNVQSLTYENNDQSMRNVFYTTMSGAEFADESLTMTYTRDDAVIPAGIFRRETHLSLSADTPNAGEEYAELKRLALIEAESYVTAESFSAQVLESRRCRYGEHYGLGDRVTVQHRDWGVSMDTLVTGMERAYTSGGETCTATFGKQQLMVTDRLKRQIRNRG